MTKVLTIIAIAELIGVTVTTFNTVMWLYFSKKEDKRRDAQNRVVELLQKEKPNRPSSNECVRCIYTDSPCMPSDYGKGKYNYCDHFKSVFEENEELKEQLTKAKDIIRNLLRVTYGEGWNYSLDVKVKAEDFLKEVGSTDIREDSTLDGDWVVDEH